MNKNAIKKFAISARTRLIATVSDKAGTLGITKDGISEPSSKGNGFEVYKTSAGTEVMLQGSQMEQRRRLVAQVKARGFDVVMEEVAYTWFNRICAIRFMEVNDYLPSRIRVLSSLKEGKNEPDLLTEAPNVELDLSEKEREWIINAKAENRLDELFSMLFIKQCNKLSDVLPELFEATEDFTEMLLNLSYTNKDDVIRMLVDGVDEKDFNVTTPDENGRPTGQVEIIGWLYQYYNTELKDDTFAQLKKNVKISKERIPAATQLFTPDWIVRYMVENSVGRIWIEHLRAINPETDEKATAENFGWKYYLPEVEQEPVVNAKLADIRKSYADIKPEDILCIDPCMGSGHIIVAMFDVLMDIYKSVGYGERDAAFEIVEHNLHGLDIDKRAYQLAYFAVMMKGRQYNRRFFRGKEEGLRPQPKVYAFVESNDVNRAQLKYFGAGLNELEKNNAITQMNGLLDTFRDAREYGSILDVENYDWDLLSRFASETDSDGQMTLDTIGLPETHETIQKIINVGETLAEKYDAVVTNPPYMSSAGMGSKLSEFVNYKYTCSKYDLFAVFISKCGEMTKKGAYYAMITQHAWMFLSSFQKFRVEQQAKTIINMIHLGARAFEEIGGEVVQTVAFIKMNYALPNHKGLYSRLISANSQDEKEHEYLKKSNLFISKQENFSLTPGNQVAYWISEKVLRHFGDKQNYFETHAGITTGDNDYFLKTWFEIDARHIYRTKQSKDVHPVWYFHHKGGSFRKWYGNNDLVLHYDTNSIEEMKSRPGFRHDGKDFYFIECATWNKTGTGSICLRYSDNGNTFNTGGCCLFVRKDMSIYYAMGLLNSSVMKIYLEFLCPTFSFAAGDVEKVPVVYDASKAEYINQIVKENIEISRKDWDAFETSWDFKEMPLVSLSKDLWDATAIGASMHHYYGNLPEVSCPLELCYLLWQGECTERFDRLKSNEEELNSLFIDIYGLKDEVSPNVEEKDITVRRANCDRDIRLFISYAVGCMFGRYSLDSEGLAFAGGEWEKAKESKYRTYIPDADGIIPVTDEEYFEDDIVGLFCDWLKKLFGPDSLENNLDYIAKVLGNKGDTSRVVIRNYFLNDFFKDHCSTYSVTGSGKRPIYWLFDSGKQNGFKALIYMHRYNQDTVGRVRTDYLHKTQKAIEQAMQSAQYTLENSKSGTEKSKATKRLSKYTKQLAEIQLYDEAIAHIANQRIALDLDDGVKVNYEKFQGVEVSREGMKTVKVDLLAKI